MKSIVNILFIILGFRLSDKGVVTTTTLYSRWICNSLVKDGRFIKLKNNTYTKNK